MRPEARSDAVPSLFLATTVFFWATQYWAIEIAAGHAPPIVITALRVVPAAAALTIAALVLRARFPPRATWLWASFTGLLIVALTLGGISEGAARAGGGNAAVLVNTSPFVVVLLGRFFLGETLSRARLAGLVVGFAGVVLIVSPQLGGGGGTTDVAVGMALALASALGFGVGTVMMKAQSARQPDLDLVGLTAVQYGVSAVVLAALAFALEPSGDTDWGSGALWGSIAWMSLGGSALAYFTFFTALKRLPAAIVSTSLFLIPVLAVIIDAARGRLPEAIVLGGMALAVLGVAVVTLPSRSLYARLRRTRPGLEET